MSGSAHAADPPEKIIRNRSEGLPERDMKSLRTMGWGLVVPENSSAVVVVVVVVAAVAPGGGERTGAVEGPYL